MSDKNENPTVVSVPAMQRMPYYLQYLKKCAQTGAEVISAPSIAESLNLNEVQVRKDLASVSTTKGKPKAGFSVRELIYNIEEILGYHNVNDAVLVGTGSLGTALLGYKGFESSGMHIVAAFDSDESVVGREINGKKVLPADKISELCRRLKVHIGIITVPQEHAQEACDSLVAGGVLAIWNFAPVHLNAPDNILVQNENMAASLALLSKHLQENLRSGRQKE